MNWYRKAADQGHAGAQFSLGNMHCYDGDLAEAVKWYRKSALQGSAKAQNRLGWMYDNGTGVAENDAIAVRWYRKSAEQGNIAALINVGVSYATGEGVPQDDVEACVWLAVAAANGNEDAKGMVAKVEAGLAPAQVIEVRKRATALNDEIWDRIEK